MVQHATPTGARCQTGSRGSGSVASLLSLFSKSDDEFGEAPRRASVIPVITDDVWRPASGSNLLSAARNVAQTRRRLDR
jgi:hypothetical protein